jgi:hypothetical protein
MSISLRAMVLPSRFLFICGQTIPTIRPRFPRGTSGVS